jgi:N,N'-diacetyllegionaminate synthase
MLLPHLQKALLIMGYHMNQTKLVTIIAEIGSIHDGSIGNALKAIEAAAFCGADVVKFQTHIAEAETLQNAPMPQYFIGEPRMDYFRRTSFSISQWKKIAAHCKSVEVEFMSSPFSLEAVDLLEEVGVEAYKIPSGEVTNLPLLEKIAGTQKKVYLSSGMSNWYELDRAVRTLSVSGSLKVMQCTSSYPCKPEQVGLNVMLEMRDRYNLPYGFSDHSLGFAASISAVALGASVIEKHFTFSKLMYGSDAQHSMEPNDFKRFCEDVREAAVIRSNPIDKNDLSQLQDMKNIFEKSIVSATEIPAGHKLTIADLAFKKPGDGISAADFAKLLGLKLNRAIPINHKFSWKDFE